MEMKRLEELRAEYHERYKKALRVALVAAAIWVVGSMIFYLVAGGAFVPYVMYWIGSLIGSVLSALFPFIVVMIVFLFKNRKVFAEYSALYKSVFVERALKEAFPGCSYRSEAGIERAELAETGMVNVGDVCRSEDLVAGEYRGMKFRQADVLIQERDTDSDGHTTYDTLFRGRWVVFDIKKDFKFKLAVVGKSFQVVSLRNNDKLHKFRKVKLESGEFHRRFNVYAQDGFEAFYLQDPAFLVRAEKLGEAYQNRVALFFVDGELHIAVNNFQNSFEAASIRKEIDEKAEIEKVKKDIKLITDIVDSLKLK